MKRIMFVEDDALICRIYGQKLKDAGFEVAVAGDGLEAVKQMPGFKPELVVLDLLMPKMTGADVLKYMRKHPELKNIPVIVFSNSFLTDLVEQVAELGVEAALVKAAMTPAGLVQAINCVLEGNIASAPQEARFPAMEKRSGGQAAPSAPAPAQPLATPEPTPATPADQPPAPAPADETANDPKFQEQMSGQLTESVPVILKDLRRLCREFLEASDLPAQVDRLTALKRKLGFLTQLAAMAGHKRTAELAGGLEALLFELAGKPASITDSLRQTIASALALLGRALDQPPPADQENRPPPAILVVDDDPISNRAVVAALSRVQLSATAVTDPLQALRLLQQNTYDLVFLDVSMPVLDGPTLCEQMRTLPFNKRTPVIFVTGHTDFQTRARSILSGGDDLIAKPIFPNELCVKALAHLTRAGVGAA